MNTQQTKQSLAWGGLLIFFGLVSLLEMYFDFSPWVWVAFLATAGVGTFVIYLTDRTNLPMLIPTYVLWLISGLISLLLLNWLPDELVPLFVLTAVALPFLAVYLINRSQWWALIPSYILLGIGLMVTLLTYGWLGDLWVPTFVMFIIALPFYVVYLHNPTEKWPLIPAGILTFIGLAFLLATGVAQYIVALALIIIGGWLVWKEYAYRV